MTQVERMVFIQSSVFIYNDWLQYKKKNIRRVAELLKTYRNL